MASGWGSPLGIAGIILLIFGIILAIVGIVAIIQYQNKTMPWWVWALLIGGIILAIIGGIMLAVALSGQKKKVVEYKRRDECTNEFVPVTEICEPETLEETTVELENDFSL